MDLYEHQARALFERYGVPVPPAEVAATPHAAREAALRLGADEYGIVVKAQVKTGGRGKSGGVRRADGAEAAERTARQILGMDIKGHTVRSVMLAQPVAIEDEFYVSYVLDRNAGCFLAVASAEGGMEIEEVAAARPEAVARVPVDPAEGVTAGTAARIAEAAGLPAETVPVLQRLWAVMKGEDALLVEVNPLVRTADGPVLALDGKITLDDNARFRQTRWGEGASDEAADEELTPQEAEAAAKGLNYVKLQGEVGIIGNGAGLVMSTLDVVAGRGARPANFLDIGGGASATVMADALSVVLSDPDVRSVLVNVFGGITACDAVAEGIVLALDRVRLDKPLVVRLDGNSAEKGREILHACGHPLLEQRTTMDDAAERAARSATDTGPPASAGRVPTTAVAQAG
ncbi:ADP-forming succinate--CoA ligase subunit beta [Streptomyces sp. NBC_01186]|uniref:ADP-forming succinate--CoA ligase subunit beta n=1 Tax=Streptomyces sp. NBC_01186 TaxID=2903765 RepID=UPI002E106EBB|nr:ADP-forming succinate--CoA ligase subunit beta [Streptomyces sp. NBC_01186]